MPAQPPEVLKSYFENGKTVFYTHYVDLIDSLGDMSKSVYDPDDDGRVENAVNAIYSLDSSLLGGLSSSSFARSGFGLGTWAHDVSYGDWNDVIYSGFYRGREMSNAPSASTAWWYVTVTSHSSTYLVQDATYYYGVGASQKWTRRLVAGVWESWAQTYPTPWSSITGTPSTYPPSTHNHDGDYHRTDQNIVNNNDLKVGSGIVAGSTTINPPAGVVDARTYVNSAQPVRVGGTQVGGLVMYQYNGRLTHSSWLIGTSHTTGLYTLTRAMFGYPSTARMLKVRLIGHSASTTEGYAGLTENSGSYAFPVGIVCIDDHNHNAAGDILLTGTGGNFYIRIGNASAYIQIEIWGYYL